MMPTPQQHPFKQHYPWLSGLTLSVPLFFLLSFLADKCEHDLTAESKKIEQQSHHVFLQIQQWNDDAKTARKLSQTLPENKVKHLLAPADRNATIAQIEYHAASSRLAHLTYTLSPPQPWNGGDTFPNIQNITSSNLTLEGDVPDDGDLITFLSSFSSLSGRWTLTHLDITKTNPQVLTRPSNLNIHIKAGFVWLANGDTQTQDAKLTEGGK